MATAICSIADLQICEYFWALGCLFCCTLASNAGPAPVVHLVRWPNGQKMNYLHLGKNQREDVVAQTSLGQHQPVHVPENIFGCLACAEYLHFSSDLVNAGLIAVFMGGTESWCQGMYFSLQLSAAVWPHLSHCLPVPAPPWLPWHVLPSQWYGRLCLAASLAVFVFPGEEQLMCLHMLYMMERSPEQGLSPRRRDLVSETGLETWHIGLMSNLKLSYLLARYYCSCLLVEFSFCVYRWGPTFINGDWEHHRQIVFNDSSGQNPVPAFLPFFRFLYPLGGTFFRETPAQRFSANTLHAMVVGWKAPWSIPDSGCTVAAQFEEEPDNKVFKTC